MNIERHLRYVRENDGWLSQAYLRRGENKAEIERLIQYGYLRFVHGTRVELTDQAHLRLREAETARQGRLSL